MGHTRPFFALVLLILFLALPMAGQVIERRKPQFQTEPSYLIFLLPIFLPGVADMVMVTDLAGNILNTNVDGFLLGIFGDVEGCIYAVQDVHLISEPLIFSVFSQNLSKATINWYEKRGMDSDRDDYSLLEATEISSFSPTLTLTLFDRRFELFAGTSKQDITLPRILDPDGNEIGVFEPGYTSTSTSATYGMLLDYTDDRQDPRVGVRQGAARSNSPADDSDSPENCVWDYNATFYIPLGDISTLALNYFRSDAQVTRQGLTDRAALEQKLGIQCGGDPTCEQYRDEIVENFIASKRNWTSTSLGGDVRLRT